VVTRYELPANRIVAFFSPRQVSLEHVTEDLASFGVAFPPEDMDIELGDMKIGVLRMKDGRHGPQALLDDRANVKLRRIVSDDGAGGLERHAKGPKLLMSHFVNDRLG
jgi:hypothetical protein